MKTFFLARRARYVISSRAVARRGREGEGKANRQIGRRKLVCPRQDLLSLLSLPHFHSYTRRKVLHLLLSLIPGLEQKKTLPFLRRLRLSPLGQGGRGLCLPGENGLNGLHILKGTRQQPRPFQLGKGGWRNALLPLTRWHSVISEKEKFRSGSFSPVGNAALGASGEDSSVELMPIRRA